MTSKHTLDLEKDKFALDGSVRVNAEGAGGGGKTSYDAADITALGASTDVNLWLAAKADGMLIKQYTSTWDNADEAITYYTHPDLGDGDYCLKILKIYTDDNSNRVLASEFPSIVTWNFDDDLTGTIALTLGAVTSPSTDSSAGTQVCTVSFTESGDIGTYELSLSGTNASSYRFKNITQSTIGSAGGTITALITDSVVIETAVNFGDVTYSHSVTVTLTDTVTLRTSSTSFATSGVSAPFSNEFYLGGIATSTLQDDYSINGTEKSLFPSKGGGSNFFPTLTDEWSLSFWMKGVVDLDNTIRPIIQMLNGTDCQLKIYEYGTSTNRNFIILFSAAANARNAWFYVSDPVLFDTWRHVVITKSTSTPSTTSLKLYIDGTAYSFSVGSASTLQSSDFTNQDIVKTVFGGAQPSSSTGAYQTRNPTALDLDQIKSWDIELSQSQVTEMYNSGKPIKTNDLTFASNIDAEFLCGDGSSDDVANNQSYDIKDGTRYIEKVGTGTFGIEQLTMDDSIYYSAIGNHKYISSPSEWSLIGGDVSGSTMPTGRIGAYQNIDSTKHLFGGANANASVAVSLWFNQTGTPTGNGNLLFNTVIVNSSDTTKSIKWGMTNYTNNRIYVTRAGITYDPNQYVTGVTSNTWHHIVVSYSSINSTSYFEEFWFNGTYMGVSTLNKSDVPYIWDMTGYTNYGFSINSTFHNTDSHSPLGGYGNINTVPVKVDQFATFNKSLSNNEVIAIFNNGTPTDLSNHNGIVHYFTMGDGDNDTGTSIECQIESGVTLTSTTDYSQNH